MEGKIMVTIVGWHRLIDQLAVGFHYFVGLIASAVIYPMTPRFQKLFLADRTGLQQRPLATEIPLQSLTGLIGNDMQLEF